MTDINSNATLSVQVDCAGNETTTTVGSIQLYDPSGVITRRLPANRSCNATVTLYRVPGWAPKQSADDTRENTCQSNRSKATNAPWSQSAPVELGRLVNPEEDAISPTVNRMPTDNAGRYGWDVSQGCWYVVVTAPGYTMLVSPVVGVPPAVTDLDLRLAPIVVDPQHALYLPMVQR
ncbi:MAG: hypothetical protein R3E79_11865 [Caldilineaceae bacterium]